MGLWDPNSPITSGFPAMVCVILAHETVQVRPVSTGANRAEANTRTHDDHHDDDAHHFGGHATSAGQCACHLFFGTLQDGPESSGAERRPGSWGCKAAESPAQSYLLPGCMALTPLSAAHSPCKHIRFSLARYRHSFGACQCSHNHTMISEGIKREGRKVLTVYRRTSTLDICACKKHKHCLPIGCIAGACGVVPKSEVGM